MMTFIWYGIAVLGILFILLLRRASQQIISISQWVGKHVRHRVLITRGRWCDFTITIPRAASIAAFLGLNALLSAYDLRYGLANILLINLIPLFLGGRTNVEADFLSIPRHTYRLAHHWIGRVFIIQSLVHSILRFSSLPGGPGKISGIATAVLLTVSLVTSIAPARRWYPTAFRWFHLLLSLTILCGATIHTLLLSRSVTSFGPILCFIAATLFAAAAILGLGRSAYRGRADIISCDILDNAVRLWVRTKHSIPAKPGTYFYIRFSGLPLRQRLQSYLAPVAFWDPASRDSTREFSFLLHPNNLKAVQRYIKQGRQLCITLDGPYGEQLRIGKYDLVMLIAEGAGIAGVLPLALSILSRRRSDEEDKARGLRSKLYCDKTRKVDLVWRLDNNAQVEWASSYFSQLAAIEVNVGSEDRNRTTARVSRPVVLRTQTNATRHGTL